MEQMTYIQCSTEKHLSTMMLITPEAAIKQVKYLNQNQTAYDKVMKEPILANGNQTIEDYFSLKDDIGGGKLKNWIQTMIDKGQSKYVT